MTPPNETGQIGVDPPVQQLIRRYFPEYPGGLGGQQLADAQLYMLGAILRQLEGIEPSDFELEEETTTANYFAEEYTATTSGPRVGGNEPEEVDGTRIDLGETYEAVDLRFDDDVVVAFNGTNNDHRDVKYRAKDSPVVGRQAQTRYIWLRRAESASSDPTVFLEAYNGE